MEIYKVVEEYIYYKDSIEMETAKIVREENTTCGVFKLFVFDRNGNRVHSPTDNLVFKSLADVQSIILKT